MIEVVVDNSQVTALVGKFKRYGRKAEREQRRAVVNLAHFALTRLRNEIENQGLVDTGEYRDSWYVTSRSESFFGREQVAVLETDSPYAARLEYGFVGVDSLGRYYDQPPRPHIRPLMETIGDYLEYDNDRVWEES